MRTVGKLSLVAALVLCVAHAAHARRQAGLKDVRALAFLAPGVWQKREFASEVGEGVYYIFVESRSQGFELRQLPFLTLQADDKGGAK
jgi:hypothetical protein